MTLQTHILTGTISPEQEKSYLLVPFEMPAGVVHLDVTYSYSQAIGSDPMLVGRNTIDIGVFDPRGADFLGDGFRGWSGSAREHFFIGLEKATPGYTPGPLQTGLWQICLGAYKVAGIGCDYEITLEMTLEEAIPEVNFPKRLSLYPNASPAARPSGWYRGELHCHSHHSDGDSNPSIIIQKAEELGLDFLALTDHNVLSQQMELREIDTPLMLIPGMEVTTYHGHWNIWGDGDWIDFRVQNADEMQASVDAALAEGYLISTNHPKPYGPEWAFPTVHGFHCVEVWNGPWPFYNAIALAYWEERLQCGERLSAVGGSDSHFHHRDHHAALGHPTTYVYCEETPSPKKLLAGLRAGHAFITESPDGPQLYLSTLTAMMGDVIQTDLTSVDVIIRVISAEGKQLELLAGKDVVHTINVPANEWEITLSVKTTHINYVRAQLTTREHDTIHVHALTNPIYFNSNKR